MSLGGGFQMVSLLDLAEITEEGVLFRSPIDGTQMLLTPEQSIRFQVFLSKPSNILYLSFCFT